MFDRSTLRRRLNEALRTDADLDAFCIDFFPEVHRRFTSGMDRVQKLNLLFQLTDPEEIVCALNAHQRGEGRRPRSLQATAWAPGMHWLLLVGGLQAAISAVPLMKYVFGVAALAAVVAITTRGFGLDGGTAAVGALIVAGLMLVLILLAAGAQQSRQLILPAMVLTWVVLSLLLGSAALLASSFFFNWPKSPPCLFAPTRCEPAPPLGKPTERVAQVDVPDHSLQSKVVGLVRDSEAPRVASAPPGLTPTVPAPMSRERSGKPKGMRSPSPSEPPPDLGIPETLPDLAAPQIYRLIRTRPEPPGDDAEKRFERWNR